MFRRSRNRSTQGRQGNRITTSEGMVRSWSMRSSKLFLDKINDSVALAAASTAFNDNDSNSGDWLATYMKEYADLFQKEIASDVSFRVVDHQNNTSSSSASLPNDVIRAHRCILAAQCPKLLYSNDDAARRVAGLEQAKPIPRGGGDDKEEIVVTDKMFVRYPQLLRSTIASCYGIRQDNPPPFKDIINPGGFDYVAERSDSAIRDQLTQLNPNNWKSRTAEAGMRNLSLVGQPKEDPITSTHHDWDQLQFPSLRTMAPPDVGIVGSPNASPNSKEKWTVFGHSAILSAHSDYFCSALTRPGWAQDDPNNDDGKNTLDEYTKVKRRLRLDSNQFSEDVVRNLVSVCYGASLDISTKPLDAIFELIDAATYLGVKTASLQCEQELALSIDATNLADTIQFAEENGAQMLLSHCHKYLCHNLSAVRQAGTLKRLQKHQIEAMLRSDFVEAPEDEILQAVVTWSDQTAASDEETKELLGLVRLPMVPIDSPWMIHVTAKNLVGEDVLRVCRLFQTDSDYRATMIDFEPMYRPRQTKAISDALQETLETHLQNELPFSDMVCRMLGTVNGRSNFIKICSIRLDETGTRVRCAFPDTSTLLARSFQFDNLKTEHMPTASNRPEEFVDRAVIESWPLENVRELLAAMLRRENGLRLHPRVQSALGDIGENEEELSRFMAELQAHVASEFHVDPVVGMELIRSASSLFPDTAQLAHYVRFNRCFEGSLCVGNKAPDVNLSMLTGEKTTLFTEIDKRLYKHQSMSGEANNNDKPVVILGASYT